MLKVTLEQTLRYMAVLLNPSFETDTACAHAAGLTGIQYRARFNHPDWVLARKISEEYRADKTQTFAHYVLQHLSGEAKKTWDRVIFWEQHKDADKRLRKIMGMTATRTRQELYLHAVLATNFDNTRAMFLCGVDRHQLRQWMEDLEFAQLIDELHFHKKNFFEKAMMDLVYARHPLAVIHANKTLNADRGYSEKIRVEHSLSADSVDFSALDLDAETKRKVLEAIRKQRAIKNGDRPLLPAVNGDSIDAEVVA